jgi:hypothetical protein
MMAIAGEAATGSRAVAVLGLRCCAAAAARPRAAAAGGPAESYGMAQARLWRLMRCNAIKQVSGFDPRPVDQPHLQQCSATQTVCLQFLNMLTVQATASRNPRRGCCDSTAVDRMHASPRGQAWQSPSGGRRWKTRRQWESGGAPEHSHSRPRNLSCCSSSLAAGPCSTTACVTRDQHSSRRPKLRFYCQKLLSGWDIHLIQAPMPCNHLHIPSFTTS